MANGFSAGDLYLNIGAVADDTLKKLDAVIERLNIINKGLGGISKTSKVSEIAPSSKSGNKNDNSLGGFLKLGKWTAVLYAGRKLGSVFANIAQKGADFSETLNLWQVSMGQDFLPQATKFVNKLNEAYGISKETLMNSQAIFKNMLGSLGQISEQSAYALSEGITQMALDYASLYNVQFEDAMTKFQAALAGQVRPIRSVSGYDITENTLFQLYQELGGTKTMRQLSRTEKQLLAILAVFEQMERSGATGDLGRTLRSFANQSRIASENFKEILTYSGLIFTRWVQTTDLFQKLNGFLIFIGDVLESVANTLPDIEVPNDPMADMAQNAEQTNKEIDKMKGKLLGFDKFRSLNPTENSDEGMELDQSLIDAFSKYGTIFDNIDNKSKEFAENLKIASGLFNQEGVFQPDKWKEIEDSIKDVGVAILIAFGASVVTQTILGFVGLMSGVKTAIDTVRDAFVLLSIAKGVSMTIGATAEAVGGVSLATKILASVLKFITSPLGIILAVLSVLYATNEDFRDLVNDLIKTLFDLIKQILEPLIDVIGALFGLLGDSMTALSPIIDVAVEFLYYLLIPVLATLETIVKVVSTLLVLLESLFTWNWSGLGQKLNNLWGDWATTDFVGKVAAKYFADGGLPDKGTMFVAGEAGAEMVYNMPSGQSGVANIKQIEQAMFNALQRHSASGSEPIVIQAYLDGEKVYENTTTKAKAHGKVWANA